MTNSSPWFFDGPNRNRWFTVLKNGWIFPWLLPDRDPTSSNSGKRIPMMSESYRNSPFGHDVGHAVGHAVSWCFIMFHDVWWCLMIIVIVANLEDMIWWQDPGRCKHSKLQTQWKWIIPLISHLQRFEIFEFAHSSSFHKKHGHDKVHFLHFSICVHHFSSSIAQFLLSTSGRFWVAHGNPWARSTMLQTTWNCTVNPSIWENKKRSKPPVVSWCIMATNSHSMSLQIRHNSFDCLTSQAWCSGK